MSKVFEDLNGVIRATAPDAPPAGQRALYPKSDGWYEKSAAGVETKIMTQATGQTKIYRATLLGANGSLTSTTVSENGLSAAIVWAYTGEGVITGTLANAFTANKTNVFLSLGSATGGVILKYALTSDDAVVISSFLVTDGTTAADFIGTIDVQISVAP